MNLNTNDQNNNMNYYVYLLECSDGKYYIGVTNDITRRMQEHHKGVNQECFTFSRRPVSLRYYLVFDDITEAILIEKKLKKWSRGKKVAFFEKEWEKLHNLAKCQNTSSHENNKK